MGFGEAVPRANILAYIAAKDPVLKFTFYISGYFFFQLYCKVRYTFAAVYNVRLWYSIRWASIHTGSAGSAVIFGRAIVFQFQVNDKFCQKEKATHLFIQQQTVLADPSYTTAFGPHAFHNGGGIHKRATLYSAYIFFESLHKDFQFVFDHKVIIFTIRILGNLQLAFFREIFRWIVVVYKTHYRFGPGHQ